MRAYARLVRLSHTLFALPFAYVGMLLAADGWPGGRVFVLVTLAMVGARTAALAVNRAIDARIDAANPRTRDREIPAGVVGRREALALAVAGTALFAVSGALLNPLAFALLPVVVLAFVVYPYTKRFTWACHAWLGATVGAAAPGGVVAVTGSFTPEAVWLWIAVGAWVAGFDVIYALLDEGFDRAHGVHSVPARFGTAVARRAAALAHAVAALSFLVVAVLTPFGPAGAVAVVAVALLFLIQHRVLAERGPAAALGAFDANLWVGAIVLAGVIVDLVV